MEALEAVIRTARARAAARAAAANAGQEGEENENGDRRPHPALPIPANPNNNIIVPPNPYANHNDSNFLNVILSTSPRIRSVKLTNQELQWARTIKQAFLREEPEPIQVSDWMVAQIAIVSQGNTQDAIRRAQGYVGFKEEYDIVAQVNYGVQCVREFLEARPLGDFMYLSNSPMESPVFVSDLAQAQGFASPVRLKGYFFLLQAAHSDFDQIRLGATHLLDCKGFDWTRNFGYKEYLQWWTELGSWYPVQTHKVRIFHSPTVANVMFSMGRKLMPKHEQDRLKLGCVSPSGALHRIYQQPNPQAARHRVLSRVREGLERRKAIEVSFSLPEP